MKKHLILSLAFVSLGLLSACSGAPVKPEIDFIGIGTGSLMTDVNTIHFDQLFSAKDHQLLAVASFAKIQNGSTVQATWFSPDERSMPLGRTEVTTQSGAKVVRFSFASKVDWKPSPYALRIDVFTKNGKKEPLTTSGSLHFFIGMKEKDIEAYVKEYQAWMKKEDQQREMGNKEFTQQEDVKAKAKAVLGTAEDLSLIVHEDVTGDGKKEYVFVPTSDEAAVHVASPGTVLSGTFTRFAAVDDSGAVMLMLKKNGKVFVLSDSTKNLTTIENANAVTVVMLPSHTLSLSWDSQQKKCTQEIRLEDGRLTAAPQNCLPVR